MATTRRNQIVDLTLPWVYDSSAFLIPVPDESANINAIVKPFQWPVSSTIELFINLNIQFSKHPDVLLSPPPICYIYYYLDLVGTWIIDRLCHHRFEYDAILSRLSLQKGDGSHQ